MVKQNIFIGVAWPYVNGDLHVGHVAGYLLPADIMARFQRLIGNNVLMVSGSDCFGTPITVEADKEKTTPEAIVEKYHARNVELFKNLGLTFDLYTKTTTDNHRKITQEFLLAFDKAGLLATDFQEQYFSESLNRFLPDRYVEGTCPYCGFSPARSDQCDNCGKLLDQNLKDPVSKIDQKPVSLKQTEHLFVKWDQLQEKIKKYFDNASLEWRAWIKGETNKWLDEGLKPRAVTRDLDWGVQIPDEIKLDAKEHKRIYVWFDAVIGYYSASLEWAEKEDRNWEDFWKNPDAKHYYFMGKDNLVFHTIFWPGQLITYDKNLNLPDFPLINQYLTLDGQKFSKSRGVTIDTADFIRKYGSDALRFYLTSIMPENADSSFTWDDFYKKNNDVLVGHIGNYVHRTLSLYKGDEISEFISVEVKKTIKKSVVQSIELLKKGEFKLYLAQIEKLAEFANGYFNQLQPWVSKKVHADLIILTYALMALMEPITPDASAKYFEMVGVENEIWTNQDNLDVVIGKIKISTPKPLFEKFEKEN